MKPRKTKGGRRRGGGKSHADSAGDSTADTLATLRRLARETVADCSGQLGDRFVDMVSPSNSGPDPGAAAATAIAVASNVRTPTTEQSPTLMVVDRIAVAEELRTVRKAYSKFRAKCASEREELQKTALAHIKAHDQVQELQKQLEREQSASAQLREEREELRETAFAHVKAHDLAQRLQKQLEREQCASAQLREELRLKDRTVQHGAAKMEKLQHLLKNSRMLEAKHASRAADLQERLFSALSKTDSMRDDSMGSSKAGKPMATPSPKKLKMPRSVSSLMRRTRTTRTAGEFGAAEARHQREMQEAVEAVRQENVSIRSGLIRKLHATQKKMKEQAVEAADKLRVVERQLMESEAAHREDMSRTELAFASCLARDESRVEKAEARWTEAEARALVVMNSAIVEEGNNGYLENAHALNFSSDRSLSVNISAVNKASISSAAETRVPAAGSNNDSAMKATDLSMVASDVDNETALRSSQNDRMLAREEIVTLEGLLRAANSQLRDVNEELRLSRRQLREQQEEHREELKRYSSNLDQKTHTAGSSPGSNFTAYDRARMQLEHRREREQLRESHREHTQRLKGEAELALRAVRDEVTTTSRELESRLRAAHEEVSQHFQSELHDAKSDLKSARTQVDALQQKLKASLESNTQSRTQLEAERGSVNRLQFALAEETHKRAEVRRQLDKWEEITGPALQSDIDAAQQRATRAEREMEERSNASFEDFRREHMQTVLAERRAAVQAAVKEAREQSKEQTERQCAVESDAKVDKLCRRVAEVESLLEERSRKITVLENGLRGAILRAEVAEKEEKARGRKIAAMRDDFDREMTERRQLHEREVDTVLIKAARDREDAVLRAEERVKESFELQKISAARQYHRTRGILWVQ